MSRRHKNDIEIIQHQENTSQGDCSPQVPKDTHEKKDFCLKIPVSRKINASILAEAISSSWRELEPLFHSYEESSLGIITRILTRDSNITNIFVHSVIEKYEIIERECSTTRNRGKRIVQRLLGNYENHVVCSWFDKLCNLLKSVIGNIGQMLCCFFWALMDTVKSENPNQKGACFYRMMKDHIKDKIPSKSSIQKGIKWFRGWRKEVVSWKDKAKEELKHKIWEQLYNRIKEILPQIEPSLVMC